MKSEEIIETIGNVLCTEITHKVQEVMPGLLSKLDVSSEEIARKNQDIEKLYNRFSEANSQISVLEFAKAKAESDMKEKSWLANELGKFVRDIADGIYEGKEIAAARRFYDLNGGGLKKKRTNAADYDSDEEARTAFARQMGGSEFDMDSYLKWLFSSPKTTTQTA